MRAMFKQSYVSFQQKDRAGRAGLWAVWVKSNDKFLIGDLPEMLNIPPYPPCALSETTGHMPYTATCGGGDLCVARFSPR